MHTAQQTKEILIQAGVKFKHFAKCVKIPESVASDFLNGRRILNANQMANIETYLKKIEKII